MVEGTTSTDHASPRHFCSLSLRGRYWAVLYWSVIGSTGLHSEIFFSLHIFCLMLIEQVIDLRNAKTENLNLGQVCDKFSWNTLKKSVVMVLIHYRKSHSIFSKSEPVLALSDCCRLGKAVCLFLPIPPAYAVQERGPKSLATDFAVQPFCCLLDSGTAFWSNCQITCRG